MLWHILFSNININNAFEIEKRKYFKSIQTGYHRRERNNAEKYPNLRHQMAA